MIVVAVAGAVVVDVMGTAVVAAAWRQSLSLKVDDGCCCC